MPISRIFSSASLRLGAKLLKEVSRTNASIDTVRGLIAKGATLNEKDENGRTPLLWAAFLNHADIAKALLDAGALPDEKSGFTLTPLMQAAYHGNTAALKVLIEGGANPCITDSLSRTALDHARSSGVLNDRADIIRLLSEAMDAALEAAVHRATVLDKDMDLSDPIRVARRIFGARP